LDLFKRTTDEEDAAAAAKKKVEINNGPVTQKNVLNGLGDLHDDDEYAEMNLESFMSSIGR
jgi:TATA-binding protein-associated factor